MPDDDDDDDPPPDDDAPVVLEAPVVPVVPDWGVTAVKLDQAAAARLRNIEFVPADVVRDDNPLRHDPAKLVAALMSLYESRKGKAAPGNGNSPQKGNGREGEDMITKEISVGS